MAHLGPHPTTDRGASSGGGTMMRSNQRLSDLGSYVTETSSVTIPTELDVYSSSGYDVDDDDVSFFDLSLIHI